MKNILARGGIEFLAVLLGISASLWIDNNNKEADLDAQRQAVYRLLENQVSELIDYVEERKIFYEKQILRHDHLLNNWESIDFDTVQDKRAYTQDISFVIDNSFRPDFTMYETLKNDGKLNLIDLETVNKFGRVYKFVNNIYDLQKKEGEWRDLLEKYFTNKYSDHLKRLSFYRNFLELLNLTKDDPVVFVHLKNMRSMQGGRSKRVGVFKEMLVETQTHMSEVQNEN